MKLVGIICMCLGTFPIVSNKLNAMIDSSLYFSAVPNKRENKSTFVSSYFVPHYLHAQKEY